METTIESSDERDGSSDIAYPRNREMRTRTTTDQSATADAYIIDARIDGHGDGCSFWGQLDYQGLEHQIESRDGNAPKYTMQQCRLGRERGKMQQQQEEGDTIHGDMDKATAYLSYIFVNTMLPKIPAAPKMVKMNVIRLLGRCATCPIKGSI